MGLCAVAIASLTLAAAVALVRKGDSVARRPWPHRVVATRSWSTTMRGKGSRLSLTVGGVVKGGLGHAVVDGGSSFPGGPLLGASPSSERQLQLPDGSRWRPTKPFRLEGPGDVPFGVDKPIPPIQTDQEPFTTLTAHGSSVRAMATSLEAVLETANGAVVAAVGAFTRSDGATVDRLTLPPGTRLVSLCPGRTPLETPGSCPSSVPDEVAVTLTAVDGLTIRAAGDGEAAVAGTASAEAIGQSWKGRVAAVEAADLSFTAVRRDGRWDVTANGQGARQLWIDVWPVVDTVLVAESSLAKSNFFDRSDLPTRIRWRNVGFATSQIYEAEGSGDGARSVGFDLNKSLGHDAGLGVQRGDKVVALAGGGDIDSNLAPQGDVERRLSATPGTNATITLRGNFPEVRVALKIPSAGPPP